jgi:D-tyrosyl-tRNA(Tyr) deacylase
MKAVIQRVTSAKVEVDGELIGSCGKGLLVLLGVAQGDTEADLDRMLAKMVKLRIFEDENGKMNRSVQDVDGELLVVSQFTLLANYKHGNRPDYMEAAAPAEAERLYELFLERAQGMVRHVGHGRFGADMKVSLLNDGPVTIVMDSDVLAPANKAK